MSDRDSTTSPSSDPRPRVAPGKGLELSPLALLASKIGSKVTGTDDVRLFSTLGRVRRLFPAWLAYSGMMMPFGILDRRTTELVILRIGYLCQAGYEWGQHVLIARQAGMSDDEIRLVIGAVGDVVNRGVA